MKYYPDAPLVTSNQKACIENYGDFIWKNIGDKCIPGNSYKLSELVGCLPCIAFLSDRTQKDYIRAVVKNVWYEQYWKLGVGEPIKFLYRDTLILC